MFKVWKDIKSVVRVTSTRTKNVTGESSVCERFYITSLGLEPQKKQQKQYGAWSIENNPHWQLDVSFAEDAGRKTGNATQNVSLMNMIASMIIKKFPKKGSVKAIRKAVGWNDKLLYEFLSIKEF